MLTYSNLSQRFFRFSPRLFGLISKHFPPLSQGSFEPLLEDSESLLEAFLPQFEDLSAYFQDFRKPILKNFRVSSRSVSALSRRPSLLFPRLSKAYFQELPSRFPKRFCLSLKTFPPTSKTFESLFSRTSESHSEALRPLFHPHLGLYPKAFPSSTRRVAASFRVFPAPSQRLHKPLSKASQASFQKLHKSLSKDSQPLSRGFQAFFQRLLALFRASRSLFLAFSPYSLRRRGRFCGSGSGPRRSGRRRRVRSMLCCNCHSFILASWPESRMSGTFQPL